MTPEQLTQARKVADQLKDRYGGAVPTSQAAALLRRQADHIDVQAAEIELLKATAARADTQAAVLRTVERWANHHARKPKTTAQEALSVIQHHPAIRAITASYADGVVPDTPDPYAEIERLRREANKSERRAITFGDIVAQQVMAMRAAYVDAKLNGSDAGMAWIENTLDGPGHLPDLAAAKKEGGAQCMFNREMAEHEAFRAAHPAPGRLT